MDLPKRPFFVRPTLPRSFGVAAADRPIGHFVGNFFPFSLLPIAAAVLCADSDRTTAIRPANPNSVGKVPRSNMKTPFNDKITTVKMR